MTRLSDGWLLVGHTTDIDGHLDTVVRLVREGLLAVSGAVTIAGASTLGVDQTDLTLAQFSPTQIAAFFDTSDAGIEGQVITPIITPIITHTSDFDDDRMFGGMLRDAFFDGSRDVVSWGDAANSVYLDPLTPGNNHGTPRGDHFSPALVSLAGSNFADTMNAAGTATGITFDGGLGQDRLTGSSAADVPQRGENDDKRSTAVATRIG